MLSSIESVAPIVKGIIQISGDAFGPTTGFLPPAEWENDQLHNLKKIAGYNHCDETSETTMMDCLKELDQYDLLKFSHKRHYRWVNDGNLVNAPYMEMIKVGYLFHVCRESRQIQNFRIQPMFRSWLE